MLENTEGAIKNGQSREASNIGCTRWRKTKQKLNTICFGHHYLQANTNKINNKWDLYQQLEVKTNWTSFICGNRNGIHHTELVIVFFELLNITFNIFYSCMYTCESNILLGWISFLYCLELNLKEDVAGATFMAAGSSAPEFFTSLIGMSLILTTSNTCLQK